MLQAHDGSWWIVFLAFRNSSTYFHHLGRETFILPVTWGADGWPVVNGNGTAELEIETECLPFHSVPELPVRDDFDKPKLELSWNFLRNPYPDTWDLHSRRGWLCLHGSALTLDDADSPAFIGRRQQHFNCRVCTKLEFKPEKEGEEAGLTVFHNKEHHYEIAVAKLDGMDQIIVRRRIGDLSAVVVREALHDQTVLLVIDADKDQYTFGYGTCPSDIRFLCKGGTQYVSTEATKLSFTGVYFGLYATGGGKPGSVPAYFDWFDYNKLYPHPHDEEFGT